MPSDADVARMLYEVNEKVSLYLCFPKGAELCFNLANTSMGKVKVLYFVANIFAY